MKGRASASSLPRRRARRFAAPRAERLEPKQLLAVFTVTTASDAGTGSLREAIVAANLTAEQDTIRFNITPSGAKSIALQSALPTITNPLTIDGTSQPGYDANAPRPMIELNGTSAGGTSDGLVFDATAGASTVRGLAINGFGGDGIVLRGGGHTITGNYIGLDIGGTIQRGNGGVGVELESSSRNVIGGSTAAARNVISGNGLHGVRLNGLRPTDATGNRVVGNYIGTDASGTIVVGNGGHGVDFFGGGSNTVGGRAAGERNVISGNAQYGVNFFGGSATRNTVIGNYIGTTADGRQALGNGSGGVFGLGNANTIGGTTAADRNVISGNSGPGVSFQGGQSENGVPLPNLVQGNYIGTDAAGLNALGNVEAGVRLFTSDAIVGGDSPAAGNRIANTRRDVFGRAAGVAIVLSSNHNAILSNEIFANGGLGIDFNQDDAVLVNDQGDGDSSSGGLSNEGQNYPEISRVEAGGGVTLARGSLNSAPNTRFRVQFFGNDLVDPSGFGEGQFYLGEAIVVTDASGNASFDAVLGRELTGTQFISATATDPLGNTSEFSRSVQAVPLPAGDLSISTAITPSPVVVGQDATVSVTVTNAGPAPASGVVVADRLPTGAAFIGSTGGFQQDGSGGVSAALGTIPAGQSRTVTYVIRPGIVGTVGNDARVSTDVIDPNPGNDSASAGLVVVPSPGQSVLSFAAEGFTGVEGDASVRITVTRTNGDGPATVRYATGGGSATAGADYQETSGVLSFAQGEFSRSFDVPLLNDFAVEGPETFGIVLSDPGGAALGLPYQALVTLLDDDPTAPPTGRIRIGAPTFSVIESAPFVTIPIERVGGFEGEARARIRTADVTAIAGQDYLPIDFQVVFSAGDAVPKLVQIPLIDDTVFDPDKTFTVTLSDAVNAPLGGPNVAVVTVQNDEPAPLRPAMQRIRFQQTTYVETENAGAARVVVERDSAAGSVAVVFRATAGTAQANRRFVPVETTVQFAEGETTRVVEIPLIDTTVAEGSQTVLLALSSPSGGPMLGDPAAATLTILDNEAPPPPPPAGTIRFVQTTYTAAEDAGTAEITLERVNGAGGEVTLFLIPDAGEARAGVDYVREAIPVTFAAGQTRATARVRLLDDTARDGNRAVGLFLTPPTGGASLDPNSAGVLILQDNDRDTVAPTLTDVTFVGPAGAPIGIAMTFSEPIDPNRAVDPRAYSVLALGRDGVAGTADDRVLAITDVSYDPATLSAVFVTASPLTAGQTYRLAIDGVSDLALTDLDGNRLDGDGDGAAGGFVQLDLTRGSNQRYVDGNGDQVSLSLSRGLFDVIRVPGADARVVRVVATGPGRSVLSGNVRRVRGVGDGATTIGRLEGIPPFGGLDVRLGVNQFRIGEVVPAAVDALLAGPAVSPLRAARRVPRG